MFHMRSSSIDMSVLNGVNIFSRDELLIRDHRDPVKKARAAGSHLLCTLMTRYQQQFKGIRPVDSGPIGKPDKVPRRTRNLQGKTQRNTVQQYPEKIEAREVQEMNLSFRSDEKLKESDFVDEPFNRTRFSLK